MTTEEFVLRPGRTALLWTAKTDAVTFKVRSNVAITVTCDDMTGTIKASGPSLEHELAVSLPEKRRLKLLVTNASGTRKARGTFEVVGA